MAAKKRSGRLVLLRRDKSSIMLRLHQRIAARDHLEAVGKFNEASVHGPARENATALPFATMSVPAINVREVISVVGHWSGVLPRLASLAASLACARAVRSGPVIHQSPFSGSEVRSGRLTGILRMREAREGWPDMWSYSAARSNRRFLMNWSALSARLRQRADISFRSELSITTPAARVAAYCDASRQRQRCERDHSGIDCGDAAAVQGSHVASGARMMLRRRR